MDACVETPLSARHRSRGVGSRCMKPEAVRILVMTGPHAACVRMFDAADACSRDHRRCVQSIGLRSLRQQSLPYCNLQRHSAHTRSNHARTSSLHGHQYDNARVHGLGLTDLSDSGCAVASGDMPPRHPTRALAAAHPGL